MHFPVAQILFWLSLLLLAWTFGIYPLLMIRLSRKRPPALPAADSAPVQPPISIVVAAYNEAERLPGRIQNLLDTAYPADAIELIVVSDGSDDNTVAAIEALADPRVRVLAQPRRLGKSACVNIAVAAATGELIVFADARQRFDRDTIPALVKRFQDPPRRGRKVGAVSGELEIAAGGGSIAAGVGAYWKLERRLREAEGILDSTIGCTGAIYAIRRDRFQPIPGDTLLDDVVIPMQVLLAGDRVVFESAARAYDPQELSAGREEIRKQRTLAGNVQMLLRHPHWLLPWRNRCLIQLISHKYLRLAGPFCLLAAAIANAFLLACPLYQATAGLQATAYILALWGRADTAPRLARIAAAFLFLNIQVLRGIRYYFFGSWRTGWR